MTPSPAAHRTLAAVTAVAAAALVLAGCSKTDATAALTPPPAPSATTTTSAGAATTTSAAPVPARVAPPTPLPADGRFDYQIGGAYAPAASVAVVSRDRLDEPATGRYSICYVNAFQTQPDAKAFWTKKHRDLLVQRNGKLVTDPDWPGEYLLNTSTAAKRRALAALVNPWIDGCARSGFQAVEPDNLDSWTRSKGVLDQADNTAFATLLAQRAHSRGLAIAQKNTVELGSAGKKIGFDFAIAEECQVYDECDAYTDVYGARVIEIEYTDNPRSAYTRACAARGEQIAVILRDRDVVAKGTSGYRYQAC